MVKNWEVPTFILRVPVTGSSKTQSLEKPICPLVFENILMLHRRSAFNASMFPWVGRDGVLKSDTLVKLVLFFHKSNRNTISYGCGNSRIDINGVKFTVEKLNKRNNTVTRVHALTKIDTSKEHNK
jgi:hypothetical protein